jgi:hypothetical protein
MNTHASIATGTASDVETDGADHVVDAAFDPDAERTERHMRALARLTEIGMEMAEITAVQARAQRDLVNTAERAEMKGGDFALAFAKVSRAVRMSIMLEDKLAVALRLRQAGIAERHRADRRARLEAERAREARAAEDRIDGRQDAIVDAVREVIRAERPERLEQERLMKSLDRLWGWNPDADIFSRPELYIQTGGDEALVSEQIAAHCKALGLKPDWTLWKDEDWAVEEAEANTPGSPYARQPETPLPEGEGGAHPQDGRVRDYGPSG